MDKRYRVVFNIYTDIELGAESYEDALGRAKEWFREEYMETPTFDWEIQVDELPDFN